MTERGGGSDVGESALVMYGNNVLKSLFCTRMCMHMLSFPAGGTGTVAYGPESDGMYRLHGYKWFTSATDANMAFTLARLADKEGHVNEVSCCQVLVSPPMV